MINRKEIKNGKILLSWNREDISCLFKMFEIINSGGLKVRNKTCYG